MPHVDSQNLCKIRSRTHSHIYAQMEKRVSLFLLVWTMIAHLRQVNLHNPPSETRRKPVGNYIGGPSKKKRFDVPAVGNPSDKFRRILFFLVWPIAIWVIQLLRHYFLVDWGSCPARRGFTWLKNVDPRNKSSETSSRHFWRPSMLYLLLQPVLRTRQTCSPDFQGQWRPIPAIWS